MTVTLGERLQRMYEDLASGNVDKVETRFGNLVIKAYSLGPNMIRLDLKAINKDETGS